MTAWSTLPAAALDLAAPASPRSRRFDDVYFSRSGGLAEAQGVFLQGIGAPECWCDAPSFAICELGFGAGVNFLAAWRLWSETAAPGSRLHYAAVEGYPLDRQELAAVLAAQPEIGACAARLIEAWPVRHAGFHRLVLDDGRVSLTLMFGDAEEMLAGLEGRIDAWFLDGFTPEKNPGMWTAEVMRQAARLSAPDARISSYTVAGRVRRALAAAGFETEKQPGQGAKRERLTGRFRGTGDWPAHPSSGPWFAPPTPLGRARRVAIVGSGIAGSTLAGALRRHGHEVTVFDRSGTPGGGMAGNPAAVLTPRLPLEASPSGRINAACFLHAIRSYDGLEAYGAGVWTGRRGVFAPAESEYDAERQERLIAALDWPEATMQHFPPGAGAAAPVEAPWGGLYFPQAGCIDPAAACRAFNTAVEGADIAGLEASGSGWRLYDSEGDARFEGDAVVLCAGAWTGRSLAAPWLSLHSSRGQVALLDTTHAQDWPEVAIGHTGFLTPDLPGPGGMRRRVAGSTFEAWHDPDDTAWRPVSVHDNAACLADLKRALPGIPLDEGRVVGGWTGLRAAPPDRLPLVGAAPDAAAYRCDYGDLHRGRPDMRYPEATYRTGLYMLAGLGARGFQTAPLMAELLADLISGTPAALDSELLHALHPGRFLIRALKRGEV